MTTIQTITIIIKKLPAQNHDGHLVSYESFKHRQCEYYRLGQSRSRLCDEIRLRLSYNISENIYYININNNNMYIFKRRPPPAPLGDNVSTAIRGEDRCEFVREIDIFSKYFIIIMGRGLPGFWPEPIVW